MIKIDMSVSQSQGDWYLTVTVGPLESREEAVKFAKKLEALEIKDALSGEPSPPPLGINISDTINTTDKFG